MIISSRSFIVHAIEFINDGGRFCSITVAMTDFRKANDSFLIQNESGGVRRFVWCVPAQTVSVNHVKRWIDDEGEILGPILVVEEFFGVRY